MRYFASKGHEMHLISFAELSQENIDELHAAGIKYHGSTGNFHLKRFWLTLNDLKFVRTVVRNEKIDVLHSHFLGVNTWYAAINGFSPHIITVMGGDVIGESWKPSGDVRERTLTPYALKKADAVTAWSPMLAQRIQPFVRENLKVEVIHGGVDIDRFGPGDKPLALRERLNIPENGSIIFSPRLIRPLYNIDSIAHAAGHVCEERPDAYFLIALPATILDSEYVAKIKEIFENNAARERVRFLSTIDHDAIADHFRLADVTVSIPDTDGTPMAVLESMACGTPTVIGNLPDYDQEYFEHEKTTLMVDVKGPRSVADAISKLLSDGDLAERLAAEARRRVEATGSYEYQMSKMEEIYRRVSAK